MGDILHALPAVTALRQAHPQWGIDWVVEPRWRALLAAEQVAVLKGRGFSRRGNANCGKYLPSGAKAPSFILLIWWRG